MQLSITLLILGMLLTLEQVKGHSWITCTDYLEMNGGVWESGKCRAYPRHAWLYTKKDSFGLDTGYDHINPSNWGPCRTPRDDSQGYNSEYPMATYFKGQSVVIAHPTKKHVADVRCTDKQVPDKGNHIYISPRNPQLDPTLEVFRQGPHSMDLGEAPHGDHVPNQVITSYPKPGFQNAPEFCENMDTALATNHFVVPDLEPGRYTFMWAWNFKQADDVNLYTSCWEADIVNSRLDRDRVLKQRGQSTRTPEGIVEN